MKQREGIFTIDHRASPGITQADLTAAGVSGPVVGEGKLFEASTMTCDHCGVIVIKNPERERERGHCSSCDRYICDPCAVAHTQDGFCRTKAKVADHTLEQNFRTDAGMAPLSHLPWDALGNTSGHNP